MPITEWHKLWGHDVWVDGRQIPAAEYRRQKRFDALTDSAKLVLAWLTKSGLSTVTLVQLCKCLPQLELRKADVIRKIMAELVAGGFATQTTSPVYYSGGRRSEAWEIMKG